METRVFGFRLRATAPEAQKRFPISRRGEYTAVARSVGKVFLAAPTVTLVTGGVDTELDPCPPSGG